MLWLHGLLNHAEYLFAQLAQVHLGAQGGTEGSERLGCVILTTEEATIDALLAQEGMQWIGRASGVV